MWEKETLIWEKYWSSASCTCPNWGSNPQPRHVPWPRIKSATFLVYGRMLQPTEVPSQGDFIDFYTITENSRCLLHRGILYPYAFAHALLPALRTQTHLALYSLKVISVGNMGLGVRRPSWIPVPWLTSCLNLRRLLSVLWFPRLQVGIMIMPTICDEIIPVKE